MSQDLRGTWKQAILSLAIPLLIVLTIRWLIIEPFVIPSGSMIPNLLINDHIMVKKSSYGFRLPFSQSLWIWNQPSRGDVVVFRYPKDTNTYFVKRLIGLPGDKIEIKNSDLYVNDQKQSLTSEDKEQLSQLFHGVVSVEDRFVYFTENTKYLIRKNESELDSSYGPITVPQDSFFMMGDNRDQSSDSRVWGFVPKNYLIGKVWFIWLSCEDMLPNAQFLCDPQTIRWTRLFKPVR